MIPSTAHCGKYPPDPRCLVRQLGKTAVQVVSHAIRTGHVLASNETQSERLETCKACIYFDSNKFRCKKCGCHIKLKAGLVASRCPLKYW